MNATQQDAIERHGRQLLAIFPKATERDPVKLCKKLRRLESEAHNFALRCCNGPDFATEDEGDEIGAGILSRVNKLLGNVREYQPKTGAKCSCKRGQQRDNCSACEGTGNLIDFKAIRAAVVVPVFLNRDARGYALKIDDEWLREQRANSQTAYKAAIHKDWGGYGIIAPEIEG